MPGLATIARLVLLATLALFAALSIIQVSVFGAPWGDTAALDLRFGGYQSEQVANFLGVIGEAGREMFFGTYRVLDTIFPPLLALSLIIVFRYVRSARGGLGIALYALLPMAYLVADLTENSFLNDLASPDMFEQAVRYASDATRLKYTALGLALVVLSGVALAARRR